MKKVLSLILALLLTFSVATIAFAEDVAAAITKDQAKEIAIQDLTYSSVSYQIIKEEEQTYLVTSLIKLKSAQRVQFTTKVDKFSGKIVSQSAELMDITTIIGALSIDKACEIAMATLGLNEANVSVMTKEVVKAENGQDAYHFVFCEGYYKTYECTVMKNNGLLDTIKIENIKIEEPTNIFQRILLTIKALISKISITNILENISAADLLKVFQFFSR